MNKGAWALLARFRYGLSSEAIEEILENVEGQTIRSWTFARNDADPRAYSIVDGSISINLAQQGAEDD